MGGFTPKSLSDKSVVAYSKAKAEGRGFDSLPRTGKKTLVRSTKKERDKKIKSMMTARLNSTSKQTLLGG